MTPDLTRYTYVYNSGACRYFRFDTGALRESKRVLCELLRGYQLGTHRSTCVAEAAHLRNSIPSADIAAGRARYDGCIPGVT